MKYACFAFLGCSLSLFAQSLDYKPAPSSPLSIPGGGHSFVAGDVDKDGHIDLVVSENNKLSVMRGDGKGGFASAPVPPTPVTGVAGEMLLADFNRDGKIDLPFGAEHGAAVFLGDGRGGFRCAAGSPFRTGRGTWRIEVIDVNHDGKPDLISNNVESNDISILLAR